MSVPGCVVAIDAGTTGVRSRAILLDGTSRVAYREFTQYFPEPGWVEHDAAEIWTSVRETLLEVLTGLADDGVAVAAIGITNQRETVVAWNRSTGLPYGRAIVWQDRRTAARCDELHESGALPRVRHVTGLVLDPYFSGTKFAWMLEHRDIPVDADLALGTIDSWILWNLTGGEVHATDPSNASRTMLFDIRSLAWSEEMCSLIGVPIDALPQVMPSSGRFGLTSTRCGIPEGIPISGIAGDQQAALFGQACFTPGMAKNTYGTGSFVLLNVGATCPPPAEGMLTTVAWTLSDGTTAYALEGAIFVTGAAVQWLRDGLQVIESSADIGPLAETVPDTGGVYLVPAFTGLGSPWWDPYARGTLIGITRGTTHAHLARATVEAMAYQTRDAVEAMSAVSGTPIQDLRVDGGAAVMDLLMQIQADQLGVPVRRPRPGDHCSGCGLPRRLGRRRLAVTRCGGRPVGTRHRVHAGRGGRQVARRSAAPAVAARGRAIGRLGHLVVAHSVVLLDPSPPPFARRIARVRAGVKRSIAVVVALGSAVALSGCVVAAGSSSSRSGAGFLFLLLPVFMFVLLWRALRAGNGRRHTRTVAGGQHSDVPTQHMLKAELSVLSDDVLRLEPQVALRPEAQDDFGAALHRYRVATAALEQSEAPVDLVRVQRVVDEATWAMARVHAILENRPMPKPPVSLQRPGQHGEPAVDVNGDRPVYVDSQASFRSGWFGGGGMFGGLLLGSILGGFGGYMIEEFDSDGDDQSWDG